MDITKLIICRQDVIILSDNEARPKGKCLRKKKKLKVKIESVRKVQLKTITINRPVPNCNRQRCRNAHHLHRRTAQNTKYGNRKVAPNTKRVKRECLKKKTMHAQFNKKLLSPITVDSSSDMFEDISSDSDLDDFEDLIKKYRERMKNENLCWPPTNKDGSKKISSDEESIDSLHSMDTVIIETNKPLTSPIKCTKVTEVTDSIDEANWIADGNNELLPMFLSSNPNQGQSKDQKQTIYHLGRNGKVSPTYEISGKKTSQAQVNKKLLSPITIDSSDDMFEDISSGSDLDIFEDLIRTTRARMNNENVCWPPTNKDGRKKISSDESMDSLHSIDTVIIKTHTPLSSPIKSKKMTKHTENIDEVNYIADYNNELEPMFLCSTPDHDQSEDQKQTITHLDINGNVSPPYEVSGKVFMEH